MICAKRVLPAYIGTSGNNGSKRIAYLTVNIQVGTTQNVLKNFINHVLNSIQSLLNRTVVIEYMEPTCGIEPQTY